MTRTRRDALTLGVAFAATTLCPFPAMAEDELVAAAQKEGRGVLYTVTDPQLNDEMLRAFKARYGITIESQRLSSAPMAQRFTAEARDIGMRRHCGQNRDGVSIVLDLPGTRPMPIERWKLLPTDEAKRVLPELLALLGVT